MKSTQIINIPPGNYLITGAAGFVGGHVLERMSDQSNVKIRGVWNQKSPIIHGSNIEYVQADLRNPEICKKLTKDIDCVLMLAGRLATTAMVQQHPLASVVDNSIMNLNMIDAAWSARIPKFIWIGSTTAYQNSNQPLKENEVMEGEPIGNQKGIGWMSRYIENLLELYANSKQHPMSVVVLRPTSIYGERDDFNFSTCHALPALLRRVVERQKPIQIWGTGEDQRDHIHVDDVVDACLLAIGYSTKFNTFNIGTGTGATFNEVLQSAIEIDGYVNADIVHETKPGMTIIHRLFDCTKAQRDLGFKSKIPLREGLGRTISWLRENLKNPV